eukprot:COSAG01_NODE_4493_length_4977_cov_332.394208_6_plen_254_part_00
MKLAHVQGFDQAASTYASTASWQQACFDTLAAKLPKNIQGHVLDLGCGSGQQLAALQKRYPKAQLLGVDASAAMLKQAKNLKLANTQYQCIDFDEPSFLQDDSQTFDLIVSNASLHWSKNISALIQKVALRLNPGGQLCLSVFLPDTFCELQAILAKHVPDIKLPAASFRDIADYKSLLSKCFSDVSGQQLRFTRHFTSLKALFRHMQESGVRPLGQGGFWTPKLFKRVEQDYLNSYGGIWARAAVYIVHVYK